jgi:hypothetical protein
MATPADAFGLFTTYRGGTPVDVGNEGDVDPGRRLDFWQNRYTVRLFAPQPIAEEDLLAFAGELSAALPAGGEPPQIMDRVPQEKLVTRSPIFFHQEISIQDYLWLGGENLLGLSLETAGVLARYNTGTGTAYLMLVQYPDTASASAALEALQNSQMDNLVTMQTRDELLGAVFGSMGEADAQSLLAEALSD